SRYRATCAKSPQAVGAHRRRRPLLPPRLRGGPGWDLPTSRHFTEQPVGHLAGEARAVLMRFEQADHGLMNAFRLLPQFMNFKAGEWRGPVECLCDTGNLLQILLADRRDHARNLQSERGINAGQPRQDDPRLAINIGKIYVVVKAAPAQRI